MFSYMILCCLHCFHLYGRSFLENEYSLINNKKKKKNVDVFIPLPCTAVCPVNVKVVPQNMQQKCLNYEKLGSRRV